MKKKERAFIDAVMRGDKNSVKQLLDEGINVDTRVTSPGEHGETALMLAVQFDRSGDMVRLLIERGADLNARDVLYGRTALMYEVHPLLLEYGADVNAKDNEDQSVLWWAAFRGEPSAVKALLNKGVQVMQEEVEEALSWANSTSNLDSIAIADMLRAAV